MFTRKIVCVHFPLARSRKITVELLNNDLHATWYRVAVERFYGEDLRIAMLLPPPLNHKGAIKRQSRHLQV